MAPPDIYTNLIAFSLAKKAVFLMIAKVDRVNYNEKMVTVASNL